MKRFQPLSLIAAVFVCLCLVCSSAYAHPDVSAGGVQEMEVWEKNQPYSFTVDHPREGVFLTIAPSPDTADPGASVFYLEYDPDDEGSRNKVECYTVTSNSSKDDLGEGLVTLKPDTEYAVSVKDNVLSLSQGDTVLFTCVMPTDLTPTNGQYPALSFAQMWSNCSRIGLGEWRQDINGFSLHSNGLNAVSASAGTPPTGSQGQGVSSGQSVSAPSSAEGGGSSAGSQSSQIESQPQSETPPASQDSQQSAGLLESLLHNPVVWVGAVAAVILVALIAVLLLKRRSGKQDYVSSDRAAPPPPPAESNNPYGAVPAAQPRTPPAATRYSDLADMVERSPRPADAQELIRRMEEYNQGPSVLADTPAATPKAAPAAAPVFTPVERSAPPPKADPQQAISEQLQRLYTDPHARDRFNEEEAGLQYVDLDDKTSVSLHYNQEAEYRLVVSSRSYLATDFMVAGDKYLFLNYYLYNAQKNNYLVSESWLKVLHLDHAFSITDQTGRPVSPSAAMGYSIARIIPAQVRPDQGGYVLVEKGRIQVNS